MRDIYDLTSTAEGRQTLLDDIEEKGIAPGDRRFTIWLDEVLSENATVESNLDALAEDLQFAIDALYNDDGFDMPPEQIISRGVKMLEALLAGMLGEEP